MLILRIPNTRRAIIRGSFSTISFLLPCIVCMDVRLFFLYLLEIIYVIIMNIVKNVN
jgi:hypothetical protein